MWTKEEAARLRLLIERYGFSAGAVASELGKTRNAVIGKCHREGIPLPRGGSIGIRGANGGRPSIGAEPLRQRTRKRVGGASPVHTRTARLQKIAQANALVAAEATRLAIEPAATGVTLMDLADNGCRAVVGPGLYCGVPRAQGSYCLQHSQQLGSKNRGLK